MIYFVNKCFCLDFDKLKNKLLKFFNNKTFDEIKKTKHCKLLKEPLSKIKKFCNLTNDIKDLLSEQNIFKISIDKCQRVIGYFIKQQDIWYFNVFLYDPFHQYNFCESNKNLNQIALKHLYKFLQISNLTYDTFQKLVYKHRKLRKILKKQ
ncbi:hypothetical protein HPP_5100 [Hydrangea phyllody phytoplasma]|uniref:Uncharacterized protein n=2 Tax=16SrI (Aster yellows group) TaxID=3042590 RepID=A0ABQ5PTE5_9MOLU|nr:hypothetical protein [Hydrangea phyllody phytoplasma]GFZ75552.1 hypothetical protein HPP_5100 [Hydrangea phyllody phytoplasma]GLH61579.1 hypothetical protein RHYP_5250 [Rhus yellows phytoplasma]GLH62002.1 hypothetical protein HP2P_4090 [Hydrangea phyllody phytoplasma]